MDDVERSDACKRKLVTKDGGWTRAWMWHPQWGGYTSHSRVSFGGTTYPQSPDGTGPPGCFDVDVYHDGEFPSDEVEFDLHYCDPMQLVRYGLDIYELMVEHDANARLDEADLLAVRAQIDRLLDRGVVKP